MTVNLKHIGNPIVKTVPVGFSWTTLFFGCIPAFLRSDFKYGLIMLVTAIITCGISWLVFPFIYNKIYLKSLLEKGYVPIDEYSKNIVLSMGIQFVSDL